MMKIIKYIVLGLIIGILGGVIGTNKFTSSKDTVERHDSITYIYDTLPVPYTEYVPSIEYRDTGSVIIKWKDSIIRVPIPVDTPSIVADYLTARNYVIDTNLNEVSLLFKETIYANRVLSRSFELFNERETEINYYNRFGVGGMVGKGKLSVLGSFQHKQLDYLIKYEMLNTNISAVEIGVIYKFKSR